ncbi:hypothetical protein BJV82DRAFT_249814 [Fennellomyces sp. T-0311]|nr:hypothetical protein BJV82DRAFT_249814 [Fennellomyces sp. T-0311]
MECCFFESLFPSAALFTFFHREPPHDQRAGVPPAAATAEEIGMREGRRVNFFSTIGTVFFSPCIMGRSTHLPPSRHPPPPFQTEYQIKGRWGEFRCCVKIRPIPGTTPKHSLLNFAHAAILIANAHGWRKEKGDDKVPVCVSGGLRSNCCLGNPAALFFSKNPRQSGNRSQMGGAEGKVAKEGGRGAD